MGRVVRRVGTTAGRPGTTAEMIGTPVRANGTSANRFGTVTCGTGTRVNASLHDAIPLGALVPGRFSPRASPGGRQRRRLRRLPPQSRARTRVRLGLETPA